jgi:hypothetical protein
MSSIVGRLRILSGRKVEIEDYIVRRDIKIACSQCGNLQLHAFTAVYSFLHIS